MKILPYTKILEKRKPFCLVTIGSLFFLFFTLGMTACLNALKDFEFKSEAKFLIPMANGSFSVEQLLKEVNSNSLIGNDSDGNLYVKYSKNPVAQFNLNELINFDSLLSVQEFKQELGNLPLDDMTLSESISLYKIRNALPKLSTLALLQNNETIIFPTINYNSSIDNDAPEFKTEIKGFIDATFDSGIIKVGITNRFPVPVSAKLEIKDSRDYSVLVNLDQVAVGKTESFQFELNGKTILAPFSVRLLKLYNNPSGVPVQIELNNGLDVRMDFTLCKIKQGLLDKKECKIKLGNKNLTTGLLGNAKLNILQTSQGNLVLKITKHFTHDIYLNVELPGMKQNSGFVSMNIACTSPETVYSYNLGNTEINIIDGNSIESNITILISSDQNIVFNADDILEFSIRTVGLRIGLVEADLGNEMVVVENEPVELDLNVWDQINENLIVNNSSLKATITNPFMVPVLANVSIKGTNEDGKSATIIKNGILINYPSSQNAPPASTEIIFDHTNSSIDQFLSLPPNKSLEFSGQIYFNPGGTANGQNLNIIDFTKSIDLGVQIEIPLVLKGDIYTYNDTLPLVSNPLKTIQKDLTLSLRITNEIPLEIELQIAPFDTLSKSSTGDLIFDEKLESAKVDDKGNVTEATTDEIQILMDQDDLEALHKANSIVIKAHVLSPDNGKKPSVLKSDARFKLNLLYEQTPKFN